MIWLHLKLYASLSSRRVGTWQITLITTNQPNQSTRRPKSHLSILGEWLLLSDGWIYRHGKPKQPNRATEPAQVMIKIVSVEFIMTNAHELLNRPLFAKNAFFNKRPFTSQQNAHSHAQHPHGQSYHPHPTSENRAVGKHGMGNHQHAMRFDTDDKPDPVSFYARYGITLKGKQTNIKCVFHSDKTPSLSINRDTGSFYCFGCGASGGDVLDFYQRYHSCDFLTACHELNLSQY